MGKYGESAIQAVRYIHLGKIDDPQIAWEKAVGQIFPDSPSLRDKGCPKGAFLGLCEEGIIRGVPAGHYTQSKKNKAYALSAVNLIKDDPASASDYKQLWDLVPNSPKTHNGQMDVVISLWENDLIV